MTREYMDISPEVHYLESVRADRGSWTALCAEAVDNSLDADATEVAMVLNRDQVAIADNGRGITRDRASAIVRLGEHQPMPGTKLGRFGMGIKYNAMGAGDLLTVDSTSADGQMILRVNWPAVIRSGQWRVPPPDWTPTLVGRRTGTTIKIERLRWDLPRERDVTAARDLLAQMFYPAIEQGAVLLVNRLPLPLLREPALTDVVERTIQLENGKGAHVRGGLLRDASDLYQVQVSYKHRVILPKSTFGCGEYSGLRRMFARVTLTADWGLARFKDGLADADAEQLEEAVHAVLRPVLEKCHTRQIDLKVRDITLRMNEMLPERLRARPPRLKDDPAERPRARRKPRPPGETDAPPTPTGPAMTSATSALSHGKLVLDFDGPLSKEHGIGMFTRGRPNRVTLATDNPLVADLLKTRDDRVATRCLFAMAMMLYEHAIETEPGQQKLAFDSNASFGLRAWQATDLQTETAATA